MLLGKCKVCRVPIGADRNPTLIEFGIPYQCVMLLRQRVPIGCRFTARSRFDFHGGAGSEAADTARAVFAQDFLLKLEGPGFPGLFSFLATVSVLPTEPGCGSLPTSCSTSLSRLAFDVRGKSPKWRRSA